MWYYKNHLCFVMLAAALVWMPVEVWALTATSPSYTLEATVIDAAGGLNTSYSYDALTATVQPGTVGAGEAYSYAAGFGFIAGAARLLEADEGEGGSEGEYEGETSEEGESTEGESDEGEGPPEGEQAEGEVNQEGEIPAEGELEGEGEEEGCGCGCCGQGEKYRIPRELMEKTLGDWLLVGLCLLMLAPFQGFRR